MNTLLDNLTPNSPPVTVCRYGLKYWAVSQGGELIAVTLYKKGALRVAQLLTTTQTVAEMSLQSGRCLPPSS